MSPARVVLATRNAGKVAELRRILAAVAAPDGEVPGVELLGLDSYPEAPEVAETEATFETNALLKARAACRHTGEVSVADDSGLAVEALNGMPGVFSARWSGRHGDDAANLDLLLGQLADVPDERRSAAFVCAAVAVAPDGRELVVVERMPGALTRAPRGSNGFGYDPVFVPVGHDVTTAELSPADKDAISHRGKAFRALADQLLALL